MKLSILLSLILTGAVFSLHAAEEPQSPNASKAQTRLAKGAAKNIGVQEFEKLRTDKNNVVLDVRTPKEFSAGHVPGAINLDVNAPDFEKKAAALDPNKTYLVHCGAGVRSARACDQLGKMNFKQLYNLEDGFKGWEKAGNKAEH